MNPYLKCEIKTVKTDVFPSVMVAMFITYNGEDWVPFLLPGKDTKKVMKSMYEHWTTEKINGTN